MNAMENKEGIYEIEFEQLVEGEKETIDSMQQIMNSRMEITVSIGSTREKLEKIANLKVGDVIVLDKYLEEHLEISANGKAIASGESIILNNKLAVRLSKIKESEDDNY